MFLTLWRVLVLIRECHRCAPPRQALSTKTKRDNITSVTKKDKNGRLKNLPFLISIFYKYTHIVLTFENFSVIIM